jgi:two-component system, NarL family, sensor histidine kinase UhpB
MALIRIATWWSRLPLERAVLLSSAAAVLLVTGVWAVLALLIVAPQVGLGRILAFLLLAVLAAVGVLLLQRRVLATLLRPLRAIETAVEEVERGNIRSRIDASGIARADIGRLAQSLNRWIAGTLTDRQRLREVAARAFRAQEAERMRIARELQEETAQTLATMLFVLRAARQTTDEEARDGMLDELRETLTRTTDGIRAYARSLHPPSLKELGVVPALESYARSLSSSSGLQIRIVGDDIQGTLPIEGELALYRVVQEALGNVVRHAKARHVLVRVRHAGEYVKTWVEDDGRGFALEETEARLPCLGLFGMRERALSVGGTVEIDSIPGDGTRVQICIPAASTAASGAAAPLPIVLRPSGDRPQAAADENVAAPPSPAP